MYFTRLTGILIAALAICFGAGVLRPARANLIQDADFTQITYNNWSGKTITGGTYYGQFGTTPVSGSASLKLTSWSTAGYNYVFTPGSADLGTSASGAPVGKPQEAPGQFNNTAGFGDTFLYGAQNGGTANFTTFPFSGNMIAADPVYETDAISQTISGLTVGKVYSLHFWWGGAQQESYSGTTSESWSVSWASSSGTQTQQTATIYNVTHGFTGWQQQTMYFTANQTSETLSFLCVGSPSGVPPFCLLGGLDMEITPEYSNAAAFAGFGIGCVVFDVARRRRMRRGGAPKLPPRPDS